MSIVGWIILGLIAGYIASNPDLTVALAPSPAVAQSDEMLRATTIAVVALFAASLVVSLRSALTA